MSTTEMAAVRPAEQTALAVPSIETILAAVAERGDPAALRETLAVFERMNAIKAEQAFNEAMHSFKSECPGIIKVKTAKITSKREGAAAYSYNYAPLEEVTKTVDPVLRRNGLVYSWDSKAEGKNTIVTCTVHHRDGHKRSASFTCETEVAGIKSGAQASGSTVTFAQRYALLMVLGVTTDLDDDARRPDPNPAPDHDKNAPKVQPRGQRSEPKVTGDQIAELAGAYVTRYDVPRDIARAEFFAWAKRVLNTESPMTSPSHWAPDCLEYCRQELEKA